MRRRNRIWPAWIRALHAEYVGRMLRAGALHAAAGAAYFGAAGKGSHPALDGNRKDAGICAMFEFARSSTAFAECAEPIGAWMARGGDVEEMALKFEWLLQPLLQPEPEEERR